MSDSDQIEEEDEVQDDNQIIEEEVSSVAADEDEGHDGSKVKTAKDDTDKITVKKDKGDPTCATYIFPDEDHTLGNALRFMLIKRTDVEFSGYNIPHPSESFMNLRLQCIERDSDEVLVDAMQDLVKLCNVIGSKFDDALAKFESGKQKHK
mmetsp:Transcript_33795/g.39301  ORF Transcript_33795/g.39301 Transcript_33795/m.39301 type:complete len:151 (-) Transcript_33795:159-611(-)